MKMCFCRYHNCKMNVNASPGPDGFGPAFFKANWELPKFDLLDLMNDFHKGTAYLARINKAYIVLLPKQRGATTPENFRPVSLPNCLIKIRAIHPIYHSPGPIRLY